MNRGIDRQTPDDSFDGRAFLYQAGQEDVLLPAPDEDLADRLKLGELAEYQCYGLLNAPVRILLNMVTASLYKTDCDGEEKFAPACRLLIASIDRCRNTESSISLIVPFMPSRRRSLGEAAL